MADEKRAPVQGYAPGIPWSLHMEAYAAYCKKWGPQHAMVEGWCRGGFHTDELDEFVPGWRERAGVAPCGKSSWCNRPVHAARAAAGVAPTVPALPHITWAHEVGWWRLELNGKTISEHKREADFKIARDRLVAASGVQPSDPAQLVAACAPYLKDGETPAECIERNRNDANAMVGLLAKERSKSTVAFEFYNPTTGHSIVDYTEHTHVGHLTAEKGYVKLPLVYAPGVKGPEHG